MNLENDVLEEVAFENLAEHLYDRFSEEEIEEIYQEMLEREWEATLTDPVDTFYYLNSVKGYLPHQKQFSDVINLIFTGDKR